MNVRVTHVTFFFLSFIVLSSSLLASPLATFNYKIFYIPNKGPVVETYFDISGRSVVLIDDGTGRLTAKVELTLIFKKNNEIVTYDKKVLDSPVMQADNIVDFIDVQRFSLDPGEYELEIQIMDAQDPMDISEIEHVEVVVPQPKPGVFVSDIELVSAFKKTETPMSFSKSGYDILPMVNDDYLNPEMKELVIYAEAYGTSEEEVGDMFLVKLFLENTETLEIDESSIKMMRRESREVSPILVRIPVDSVATGEYNIVLEIISKENQLLARQTLPVFRSHPGHIEKLIALSDEELAASWVTKYKDKDQLYEYFNSLRPLADKSELTMMDNTFSNPEKVELSFLQRYFYRFWELRDDENPESAWLEYLEQVKIAEAQFGTRIKKGYETDRGRVYLRYGPPNDLTDRSKEPSSYPYQIWRYYKARRWNNVKFVFYDTALLNEDYELLHCDYIPGEIQNPQWRLLLDRRTSPINNVDRTNTENNFGGRVDDLYTNPR